MKSRSRISNGRPQSACTTINVMHRSHSETRPLSGRSGSETMARTISSSTFSSMAIQGKQIRPSSAFLKVTDIKEFGFWFYKWPKSGSLPYTNPKYSIPKWKSK